MKTRADLAKNQLDAVEWMLETPRGALWKDIGLGKTVTTLTTLDILHQRFEIGNTLVVSPLRVARSVWPKEVRKWEHLQHMRVVPILGTPEQRSQAMDTPAEIHTINFENLVWLIDHFKKKGQSRFKRAWPWDTVIIDESSGFKNRETARWKALRRVIRQTARVYELTGSPAPNGYVDVWAPMYLLDFGQRLGTTLTAYRHRWFNPPEWGNTKWTVKSVEDEHGVPIWSAEDEINGRIADIVLPMRAEDYLDLPKVMENEIPVELSPQDAAQYHQMEKELWLELQGEEITAVNRGVLYQKLLQLANGSIYTGDDGRWVWFHDAKLDVMSELVSDSLALGRPAMVIHAFRADQERIEGRMKKMGVRYRLLKSQQDEDDWNEGRLDVLGMHPKSGGHGLNLQDGGETVIWFGLNPSWELYNQTNGRLAGGRRRLGKNIRVHRLVTEGTLDEDVIDLLEDKEATEDRLWAGVARRQKGAR